MKPPSKRRKLSTEDAETLGLQALAFIAGEERALLGLIAESGLAPDSLGRAAGDAAFLGCVLDFMLRDEALLLAFCDAQDLPPELPAQARTLLPGAAPE